MTDSGVRESFNNECPVCFDESEEMFILSCKHRIHEECSKGLIDTKCPICRLEVENWPSEIQELIEENMRKRKLEIDRETEEEILEEEQMRYNIMLNSLRSYVFMRITPQEEFEMARRYLISQGVPECYIPGSMDISVSHEQLNFIEGIVFDVTVNSVLSAVLHDIESVSDDESDED